MDINFFYNLPTVIASIWTSFAEFDARLAFVAGILAAVISSRLVHTFESPATKILSLLGFITIVALALGFWVSFSGSLEPGEIPFSKATVTPGVDTLIEVQK
jgi:hypothetical protein